MTYAPVSPETELLLTCARTDTAAVADQVRARVGAGLNWDALGRQASRHNLRPLLYWHLKTSCPNATPPAVLAQLEEAFQANTWLNLHLSREVLKIVKLLRAGDVRVIPFKGVMLAASVYGNLSLRHAGDIDLLVSPAEVRRAKQLLLDAGFKAAPMSAAAEQAYLQTANHFNLSKAETRTTVELHWQINPQRYRPGADFETLWQRTQTIDLLGERVPSLSPEDLLSYLCVHLLKHQWPNLRWLTDIAELLRAYPDSLNWTALQGPPPVGGSPRMVRLGLYLTHQLLAAPLPAPVAAALKSDPALPPAADFVSNRLFEEQDSTARADWEYYRFQLSLLDNFRERARFLRYLVTPHNTAPGHLSLPRWLFPLYYVTRPLRFFINVSRNSS